MGEDSTAGEGERGSSAHERSTNPGNRAQLDLQSRHDALVEQVRELHWDLGGLAYEMAIRDHFRLDVLVRRAAVLQERDAELAEIERLLRLERDGVAGACPQCAAPHSRGALYCWQCGAQLMERAASGALPVSAQAHEPPTDGGSPAADAPAASKALTESFSAPSASSGAATGHEREQDGSGAQGTAPAAAPGASTPSSLPSPRVSALLVLVFLAFGTILGGAAGSRVDDTLAASASPEQLVLPAVTGATASSPSSSSKTPETPPAEPTPAPPSTTSASTAAAKNAPKSTGSEGKSSEQGSSKSSPSGASPQGSASKLPAVKHVFVIMLSDEPYAALFGPSSTAPYLAHTLETKGELLTRYYSVAHQELAGEIALLSGQGATPQTQSNCPTFADISPGTVGAEGQATGEGCVYPQAVETLADQLRAKQLSWRAYIQGIEEAPSNLEACAHPALGQPDPSSPTQLASPAQSGSTTPSPTTGPYATFRNPFVYFHSLIDAPSCQALDVGLGNLDKDLASAQGAPAFSYIAPDLCDDASPTPCAPGAPAGPAAAEGFLKRVVPKILASTSYKEAGLLVITADQAPSTGELADSSACCGQPRFPDLPQSATEEAASTPLPPPGGGQVGALLLSPFVKPGTTSQEALNTFSLLRLFEDLFGLHHLGYAGSTRLPALEPGSIFTASTG